MPAPARRHLVLGRGLGQEHGRLEVDLVDLVEGLFGDFQERLLALDADAVDQDVEAAVKRHGPIHRIADLVHLGHVHGQARGLVAAVAQAAGQRQAPGDRLAETAVATGQVGDLAVQAEGAGELAAEVDSGRDLVHEKCLPRGFNRDAARR